MKTLCTCLISLSSKRWFIFHSSGFVGMWCSGSRVDASYQVRRRFFSCDDTPAEISASRVSQPWWWLGHILIICECASEPRVWFKKKEKPEGHPFSEVRIVSIIPVYSHTLKVPLCDFNDFDCHSSRAINWSSEDERSLGKKSIEISLF